MTADLKPKAKPSLGAEKLTPEVSLTKSERFIKAAQELETDDPERFADRVRKIAKAPKTSD